MADELKGFDLSEGDDVESRLAREAAAKVRRRPHHAPGAAGPNKSRSRPASETPTASALGVAREYEPSRSVRGGA